MHIVTIASEATPFVKTGGLADVVGSLFRALSKDHRLTLIMPYYKSPQAQFPPTTAVDRCTVLIGGQSYEAVFHQVCLGPRQNLVLIEQDLFFFRPGLYGLNSQDYTDNFHRFYFFGNAAAQWLLRQAEPIDIVHCHDWQTGLVPMILKTNTLRGFPTLFTIHNISFQGRFPECSYTMTHLPGRHFNPDGVEFYGELNFLKGGIRYSDRVSTVSPSYAQEIQTAEYGAGLDGLLRACSSRLSGIINGIDTDVWNPCADPFLHKPLKGNIDAWKKQSRSALRQELNLPDSDQPLFVMIGRLTYQKGIDLVLDVWENQAPSGQLVVLGTGDSQMLGRLTHLQDHQPCLRFINQFSEALAHRLQAGADFFLMPSRFEPCGLTQMFAQRYGTIPLVTQTGGLRDTVVTIGQGENAAGIPIPSPDAGGLKQAISIALGLYEDKQKLSTMRKAAMSRDFSWQQSCRDYSALFKAMMTDHHESGKRSLLL